MNGLGIGMAVVFALASGAAGYATILIDLTKSINRVPTTPHPIRNAFIGAVLGGAVGYGAGVALDNGGHYMWDHLIAPKPVVQTIN